MMMGQEVVAEICCKERDKKTGKAGATYSIRKEAGIAGHTSTVPLCSLSLSLCPRKIGKGQDGLGTVDDMVGGRRVSRNISQPG
jgi:hypothetical protein